MISAFVCTRSGGSAAASAVACVAADRGRELELSQEDVGAREVVDRHVVGSAQGVEPDDLDIVRVHRDVGGLAEEGEPTAVRAHHDIVVARGSPGSVEQHRVDAGAALDHVAALTRIPLERVVATAETPGVVAPAAIDVVVAAAALELLCARATLQRVAAVLTGDRGRDGVGERSVRVVDAESVGPVAARDLDRRHVGAQDGRLGRPVVAEVDLEPRRVTGLQAQCDGVGSVARVHEQPAVVELYPLAAGAIVVGGRRRRDGEGGEHGAKGEKGVAL